MRTRSLVVSEFKISNGGFMKTSVKLVSCLLLFILLMTISCSSPQTTENKSVAPENELVGVWKLTEVILTGPDARTITVTTPNLLIYTKKHFSYIEVAGPRPDLPQKGATDAQKVAAWTPFDAFAGTYEVNGTTSTAHSIVSKDPSGMVQGNFGTGEFKIEGNILILTVKAANPPLANPYTAKFVRVE
jgi:hypothetical protein